MFICIYILYAVSLMHVYILVPYCKLVTYACPFACHNAILLDKASRMHVMSVHVHGYMTCLVTAAMKSPVSGTPSLTRAHTDRLRHRALYSSIHVWITSQKAVESLGDRLCPNLK